jgi:putative oxidoreductase
MSDIATASRGRHAPNGEMAMARLADRLAAMAPQEPLNLTTMQATSMPRPSPAVSAALSTSKAISARAAERARRSRSVTGLLVDGFVAACSLVPYAVVALALRLVMARVFFLDGQTRIDGPRLPLDVLDFNFSLVLPAQVRPETFTAFLTQYPPLPIPPVLAAYTVSYAEFVLPILLVLGFATRFAALSLLVMTALISLYVMPQALLSAHIYWAGMLLVLLSQGAGQISVDAVIRYVARR